MSGGLPGGGIGVSLRGVSASAAGGGKLLEDISFDAAPGTFTAVLGPSGCGKSTLVLRMAGIAKYEGGIYFNGRELRTDSGAILSRLAYLPQAVEDTLYEDMTVRGAMDDFVRTHLPAGASPDFAARLSDVGLDGRLDVPVAALSGGQKRRLALALALLREPGILVLDEPTAGLDPAAEAGVMSLLRRIADGGRTVICATHVLGSLGLCDKVLVLASGGRRVFEGAPREALEFFGTDDWCEIYRRLQDWKGAFAGAAGAPPPESALPPPRAAAPAGRVFRAVFRRLARSVAGSWKNLAFFAGAPVLIAMAMLVSCESIFESGDLGTVYFCMSVAMFWLGLSGSVRSLVSERVPKRCLDRMRGVPQGRYFAAHVAFMAFHASFQALLFVLPLFMARLGHHPFSMHALLPFWTVLALSGVAGGSVGLFASAVAKNELQAVWALPGIAIIALFMSKPVLEGGSGAKPAGVLRAIECAMPTLAPQTVLETTMDSCRGVEREGHAGNVLHFTCVAAGYPVVFLLLAYLMQGKREREWGGVPVAAIASGEGPKHRFAKYACGGAAVASAACGAWCYFAVEGSRREIDARFVAAQKAIDGAGTTARELGKAFEEASSNLARLGRYDGAFCRERAARRFDALEPAVSELFCRWAEREIADAMERPEKYATDAKLVEIDGLFERFAPARAQYAGRLAEMRGRWLASREELRGRHAVGEFAARVAAAAGSKDMAKIAALYPPRVLTNAWITADYAASQWKGRLEIAFEGAYKEYCAGVKKSAGRRRGRPEFTEEDRAAVDSKAGIVGEPFDAEKTKKLLAAEIEKMAVEWTASRKAKYRRKEEDLSGCVAALRDLDPADAAFGDKADRLYRTLRDLCREIDRDGDRPADSWAVRFAESCMKDRQFDSKGGCFRQWLTITNVEGALEYKTAGGKYKGTDLWGDIEIRGFGAEEPENHCIDTKASPRFGEKDGGAVRRLEFEPLKFPVSLFDAITVKLNVKDYTEAWYGADGEECAWSVASVSGCAADARFSAENWGNGIALEGARKSGAGTAYAAKFKVYGTFEGKSVFDYAEEAKRAASGGGAEAVPAQEEEPPVGLVLSGGGAKGAYEIGVWQEMQSLGLAPRVAAISGTSAGALNAALFAARPHDADKIWFDRMDDVFTIDRERVGKSIDRTVEDASKAAKVAGESGEAWKGAVSMGLSSLMRAADGYIGAAESPEMARGYIDSSKMARALDESLPEKWPDGGPAVYATAVEKGGGGGLKTWRIDRETSERRSLMIRASAAFPVGFDAVEIDGKVYVDGGWEAKGGDNTPLAPILENHPGIKTVIVVFLKSENRLDASRREKNRLAAAERGVRLVEIVPSEDIDGVFGVGGLVDHSRETALRLAALGRKDARAALASVRPPAPAPR